MSKKNIFLLYLLGAQVTINKDAIRLIFNSIDEYILRILVTENDRNQFRFFDDYLVRMSTLPRKSGFRTFKKYFDEFSKKPPLTKTIALADFIYKHMDTNGKYCGSLIIYYRVNQIFV